ncbi:MAG: DNA methyltransferase [Bacteroidota bacterium]
MLTFPTINNSILNRVVAADSAGHDWYRFVLSFPPHLVREYADRFGLQKTDWVLDPFCGTGTTIVECKKLGIPSIGVEPHPMCHFAGRVKTRWHVDPLGLRQHAERIAEEATRRLHEQGVSDNPLHLLENVDEDSTHQLRSLPHESFKLLLTNSISPRPLHKTLVLLDVINEYRDVRFHDHLLLALAKSLVASISNLHFGPEVGVGKIKNDAPVIHTWMAGVQSMARDMEVLVKFEEVPAVLHQADARSLLHVIDPASISAVITSPPYPNEKDYTRTTRLESVILGFLRNKHELRDLKQHLLRSNTRNVYKGDDDDQWVASHAQVERIARSIEERRIELGKTSGFERLYHRVTRLYFGGMARHFSELRHALKPGAQLAYVVGDQASYLRVMIRTGQLLADIASSFGYEVSSIDLFRTRLATATKDQLREEVVVLRWPGRSARIAEPSPRYAHRKDHGITMKTPPNRYSQIIERIFLTNYKKGATEVPFAREEIGHIAKKLSITLPKNLGDIIYSFRYRADLPEKVRDKAPTGKQWVIRPAGRAKYCFALISEKDISPNELLAETKIPDSTPGLIALYALDDEQALLAKLRYNRLLDIFTGITCYSLQNHLRTSVAHLGQVETDEVYVGVDKRGVHYALPVQAKGGKDRINVVQIEQDFEMCKSKFPHLVCRAIGAQFVSNNKIALFEFENTGEGVKVVAEKHYQLVAPEQVTPEILKTYRQRLPEN